MNNGKGSLTAGPVALVGALTGNRHGTNNKGKRKRKNGSICPGPAARSSEAKPRSISARPAASDQ